MHEQYTYHDNKWQQREGARELRVFKNNSIYNGYKICDYISSMHQEMSTKNYNHKWKALLLFKHN